MKKFILIYTTFVLMACTNNETEKNAIITVMNQQEQDWNAGNIEGFMEGYWQSDSLLFIGKNGMKYGWETTLNNYKKSYPDKKTMGKLTFDIIKLEVNNNVAYMLGKWSLVRATDNPNGHFTLYWKKINDQWKITIDHTS